MLRFTHVPTIGDYNDDDGDGCDCRLLLRGVPATGGTVPAEGAGWSGSRYTIVPKARSQEVVPHVKLLTKLSTEVGR